VHRDAQWLRLGYVLIGIFFLLVRLAYLARAKSSCPKTKRINGSGPNTLPYPITANRR
jgi:hypothetical protein